MKVIQGRAYIVKTYDGFLLVIADSLSKAAEIASYQRDPRTTSDVSQVAQVLCDEIRISDDSYAKTT